MECRTEQSGSISFENHGVWLNSFSKICVVVRSEMDVFDRFTSKAYVS